MDFVRSVANLFESVLQNVKQRVKSPLTGTFIISWLLFNWKFVYFLLMSDLPVDEKIHRIEIHYIDIEYNLLFPVYTTIAYVVFYPLLSQISNTVWIGMDKLGNWMSTLVLEKNVPITQEEKRSLYSLIRQKQLEFEQRLSEKQAELDALHKAFSEINVDNKSDITDQKVEHEYTDEKSAEEFTSVDIPKNTFAFLSPEVKKVAASSEFLQDLCVKLSSVLSMNYNLFQDELIMYAYILGECADFSPAPWEVSSISVALDGTEVSCSKENARDIAEKLRSHGFLKLESGAGRVTYSLTYEGIRLLNQMV